MGPFQILLFVIWAVSAVALTILVLMHSGKGTGVSDIIASSLYNSSSATGVHERVPQCGTLFVYKSVTESKYPHILRPTKEILDR